MPQVIDLLPAILPNGEVIYTTWEESAVLNGAMLLASIVCFLSSMLQKGLWALLNPPRPSPIMLARLGELVREHKRRTLPPPPGTPAAAAQPKQAPQQPADQRGRYKPRTRTRARSGILRNTPKRSTSPVALD